MLRRPVPGVVRFFDPPTADRPPCGRLRYLRRKFFMCACFELHRRRSYATETGPTVRQ